MKKKSFSYFSEEELFDAKQQLQQLLGEPMTPPKIQAPAMPPLPRKEEFNQETKEETESTGVVRNLSL